MASRVLNPTGALETTGLALAGAVSLAAILTLGPTKGLVAGIAVVFAGFAGFAVLRSPLLGLHLVLAIGFTAMGVKRVMPQLSQVHFNKFATDGTITKSRWPSLSNFYDLMYRQR